ncbi:DEAD/DEAH box helicase [uncultured Paludibaculum sp.]|uniref:DEAD/DEAH box helicase n=1 Tax=uncultured Paludibaculum sp. TaxID=1765020 RepID=UPI002AAA84A1|nr:DEAD/DEAH box helicase [uncultured Paludibaculum sp.]
MPTGASPLSVFDPLLQEWFAVHFQQPTAPQIGAWPEIAAGRDVLVAAPTGSGKTLAAFLFAIDRLVRAARLGPLPDETQIVYVSPLKALSNDVHKNLELPLSQIAALAKEKGIALAPIRTAIRTGDTPAADRLKMTKQAPHILVTTPESLYILMTADRSRRFLRTVTTVIIDEIHAIVGDKRGSHLALTLARLNALCARPPQRVGLSATVRPIEEVARFLSPHASIVDVGHRREMDLSIEVPNDELGAVATMEMWAELYDRMAAHIARTRTTLVFVNTRRMSERVAHALAERLGENVVLPHHGSLSRALRMEAESRLKSGELRAVVATASLELGIDIGTVDLTIQIGSTRSIAVALQRIGRSGHWVGARPAGIFFPSTRDDLIECAALVHAIRSDDLETVAIPENALDILAQQIIAECAAQPWSLDDLFALIRTAYPYRGLERAQFDSVIEMASEGIATSRGRSGAMLHRDQVNGMVRGRRGARLAAITSGGAIPDTSLYSVVAEPDGANVGTLDEDFAVESQIGDIFLLGTHSWRIRHVMSGRVHVEDAHGAPPSVPFWLGEAPGRSAELSAAVSRVRLRLLDDGGEQWLIDQCGLDSAGARQGVAYVREGAAQLGALPSLETVVAERFFDESGGMQLILHAPFGSRVNRAWGLALRKRFCRTFNFELQAAATDNGIVISLSDRHAFPLELIFQFLKAGTARDVLIQALLDAPMFGARWRWNVSRALAILRFNGGKRVPPPIQRMRSEDLLAAVFPDQVACAENLTGPIQVPDHPLVNETIDNCLREAMDLDRLIDVLRGIEAGTIRTEVLDLPAPSVFSHEILNANPYAYLDDAPIEERRARAVQLRQTMRTDLTDGSGILDPAAIAQVTAESWPDVRDADELHDALLTVITMPPQPEWALFFQQLEQTGRASVWKRGSRLFWTPTEKKTMADDALAILRGWMESTGPSTVASLSETLAFPVEAVESAMARLEFEGQVLSGHFTNTGSEALEWCNRRVLARIHRTTLGRLRREIAPVTAQQFHAFLAKWQHVAPGTQLHGADGLFEVIRQLQGYEVAASAWEAEILPCRIANYEPELLDDLCLSGDVTWARVSPHPALEEEGRKIRPTKLAPIAMMVRDDAAWLMSESQAESSSQSLSHPAQAVLEQLRCDKALFFNDLVRTAHRLPSEVEDALWELVAAGLVTADGFENLRSIIDPKRRRGEGRGRHARPRHAAGRWALVQRTSGDGTERVKKWAEQLLLRWGVILRDLLAREAGAPPWRELLPVLRRMEAQGQIRGGRFIDGFTGEQFARPEALDLLRAVRRDPEVPPLLEAAPADPLNLTGIILPGPRVSRLA